MNLYRTIFRHHSPKDSATGTICLLLANSDEEVYEFLKTEPSINGEKYFLSWQDNEDEEEERDLYDDDDNLIGTQPPKEYYIKNRGQLNDEEMDYSDAYYGITMVGWELVKENTTVDYSELIELGQMLKVR